MTSDTPSIIEAKDLPEVVDDRSQVRSKPRNDVGHKRCNRCRGARERAARLAKVPQAERQRQRHEPKAARRTRQQQQLAQTTLPGMRVCGGCHETSPSPSTFRSTSDQVRTTRS